MERKSERILERKRNANGTQNGTHLERRLTGLVFAHFTRELLFVNTTLDISVLFSVLFYCFWARVTFLNVADEVGTFKYVTIAQKPRHKLVYIFILSGMGFRLSTFSGHELLA